MDSRMWSWISSSGKVLRDACAAFTTHIQHARPQALGARGASSTLMVDCPGPPVLVEGADWDQCDAALCREPRTELGRQVWGFNVMQSEACRRRTGPHICG